MKKLILMALAVPFVLTSCDFDTKDSTHTTPTKACNLITNLDRHTSVLSTCEYTFLENLTQNTISVSTGDLKINNRDHSFSSDPQDYKMYSNGYLYAVVINNIKANFDNDPTLPIRNYKALFTTGFFDTEAIVSGLDNWRIEYPMLINQYYVGDEYSVKTIQPLCYYSGDTYIDNVNGSFGPDAYKNNKMLYRVKLDIDKNKAQVVIYNAKFAEAMPVELEAVVLEDLDVNLDNETYTITGYDVVPKMPDGGALTPNNKFIFNEFELNFNGDDTLTKANITYKVANMYKGSFRGSYIIEHNFSE